MEDLGGEQTISLDFAFVGGSDPFHRLKKETSSYRMFFRFYFPHVVVMLLVDT